MSRNANNCSLITPGGVVHLTAAEMRRLVSMAMTQVAMQQRHPGLNATELSIKTKIETARWSNPHIGL